MKLKSKILRYILIFLGFSLILTSSCEEDEDVAQVVKDIEGNVYKTVTIGTQAWMAENLKTTKYNDGSDIINVKDNLEWTKQINGAFCWYKNEEDTFKNLYGALYNYYTVVDNRKLCPEGWHVPTNEEWITLTDYLGGEALAGGKLRATYDWMLPNIGADNSSKFSALPGGYRLNGYEASEIGEFTGLGEHCAFWSSSEFNSENAWNRSLYHRRTDVLPWMDYPKWMGCSVRCIKD